MKIAYLVNQYPKVSHSFIRREILALERQGFEVERFAVNNMGIGDLVDQDDLREKAKTVYLLEKGIGGLIGPAIRTLFTQPAAFFKAFKLALRMGWRADRPLPYHLIYLAEACKLAAMLKQRQVSHLHAHFGTNSAEVAMFSQALGGPSYSFTVHGPEEFDKPNQLGLRQKIRHAAFVVAITSYARSQLFRWSDYRDWNKIKVVHCGLEKTFYDVPARPSPAQRRLVCVGRLCEQKGQLLLIDAFAELAKKGLSVELVLAGDGEMRAEIEASIRRHQLHSRVRITGWISSDQVRDEILQASALILPSFAEGLPVVIMEALALRRPVLTTYVAGVPELIRHGESGWLFPAGDVAAISNAVSEFLSTPQLKLEEMAETGFARVVARHSIELEAEKLGRHFRETLLNAKPAEATVPIV